MLDGVEDVHFLLELHLLPDAADGRVQAALRGAVPGWGKN